MKGMGETSYILGIKIHKNQLIKLLVLSQESYIRRILEKIKIDKCKPMDTPISKRKTFNLEMCPKTLKECSEIAQISYFNIFGSLIYIMMCTRPDILLCCGVGE